MGMMNNTSRVKVYCKQCKKTFWHGNLLQWGLELQKRFVPAWFTKARMHEKETGHTVMVKYPSQTVGLMLRDVFGQS